MSKKNDWISLGEAYKDVFKKVIVKEGVPDGEIGDAPLEAGGPTERGGFKESEIDVTKMGKKENKYNVRGYSYGDGNDPGLGEDKPEPTGPTFGQVPYSGIVGNEEDEENEDNEDKTGKLSDKALYNKVKAKGTAGKELLAAAKKELDKNGSVSAKIRKDLARDLYGEDGNNEENEENLGETEKIARESLNNFMAKKSVFDRLYDKVMVSENFPEMEELGNEELDALGLDEVLTDDELDEVPEEIAVTIPGELAQTLCDILQTALAQQETEVDIDVDVETVEDVDFESEERRSRYPAEDEEAVMKDGGGYGVDAGSTLKKEINYGKKNKVGKLRPATGLAQKDGGGYGVDAGSTLSKEVNYGKQNKVGNLKPGPLPGA
tara:strand:- start:3696 stop:4829 length:1134 start_codon:yes stop_codon:yes gene_type:complete